MLKFNITHQEVYSRRELLLRSFFGIFYILIPHFFLIYFYSIWVFIAQFIAWWIILITGKTPEFYYTALKNLNKWSLRVMARMLHLSDGYPEFGPSGNDNKTELDFEHIHIGRSQLLLRSFFGIFYIAIPHSLCLIIRFLATYFLIFLSWWSVLFTSKYPANWHKFNVGTFRWATRVNLYMSFFLTQYPPFSGKPFEITGAEIPLDQM